MTTNDATIILIPDHWLGAWAWDEVVECLERSGDRPVPLTLPGLEVSDPERASRTLDEQALAVANAVDAASAEKGAAVVVVAHSGANGPVSLVLDQDPDRIARVIWVDSGPATPGAAFAPDLPPGVHELPLPPFEELAAQASLDGLTVESLARFRARAVPQPSPVLREPVHLSDEARLRVPPRWCVARSRALG